VQGAARIAQLLLNRGVRLASVLDEGGLIADGVIPGVAVPVALVGIAEKGYLTLELTAEGEGGHSSMPQRSTAIGILGRALLRLEETPFPADLSFASRFFAAVAAGMSFPRRVALRHPRLFAPWLARMLSRSPQMNALIRTTAAPTLLSAGVKENVLPETATAVVNFRVMPGEQTEGVIERARRIVGDPRVRFRARPMRSEPSPVSDVRSASYAMLERTIRQVAADGELLVAPCLVVGATDSRHFSGLADDIYRFSPVRVGPEDLRRVHGTDERISLESFMMMMRFYGQLLRNAQEL
jgi:carboxypeptidase PM20D1